MAKKLFSTQASVAVGKPKKEAESKKSGLEGEKIGYARVSTCDQNLDAQIDELESQGCSKSNIYQEKASGAKTDRPILKECLAYLRKGDVLVVTKLDRLARSLKDLIEIVEKLDKEMGVGFISVNDKIDTSTPQGKFFFHVFGAVAEFERDLIRERTNAGLKAAKARGRIGGRKRKMTPAKIEAAKELLKTLPPADVANQLGISRATLYNYYADLKG